MGACPRTPLPWHGHVTLTRPLALAPPIFHEVSATVAINYYRRAFPGLCSSNVVRNSSAPRGMPSTSSRSLVEPKPKKAKLQGYMPLSFTPLETWTHDICVLGRCDEGYTTNRERNDVLVNAGLGKMKLVFPDKKAKHADVQSFPY